MRLSTFSFSLRVGIFAGILVAAIAAAEAYCRSPSFAPTSNEQVYLRNWTLFDSSNAAFGDSQMGSINNLGGFQVYSPGGLQTSELLRVVKYVYASTEPKKVVIELAPQWFGEYHKDRPEAFGASTMPPPYLRLLVLSPYFHKTLKDAVLKDVASFVASARADEIGRPGPVEVNLLAADWLAEIRRQGIDIAHFRWSTFPAEKRAKLTIGRAYEQNPVVGFETSQWAKDYEAALSFLLEKGATVCLYEPPVTAAMREVRTTIERSNYAAFDAYGTELATRMNVPWVRFLDTLPDSEFNNQDHLNEFGLAKIWPQVFERCFA